jgi:SNF2 family DNA or RNA helicase
MGVRGPKGTVPRDPNGFPRVPLRSELKRRWGTVIVDEAHYIKGRKTWWSGCVQELGNYTDRVILLTGTPLQNWAHEAFTLLQMIYPEKAKAGAELGSYWRWVKRWFQVGSHWSQYDVGDLLPGLTWEEFRAQTWGENYLLRLRENCLDLPPLTIQPWKVHMGAEQKRVYKQLKKDYVTWLDSGAEVSAWSTAGQVTQLAKCATGLEVLDPSHGHKGSAKLKALEELLIDRPRQTLVVGHFQNTVEACSRAAKRAGRTAAVVHGQTPKSQRVHAIRAFQSGTIDVLCASVGTISEGLTLHQSGCDQIIRVEKSWVPSRNEQVVRRLHRIGQENPVLCIDLCTVGTMDEKQDDLLKKKTDQQALALGIHELRRLAA